MYDALGRRIAKTLTFLSPGKADQRTDFHWQGMRLCGEQEHNQPLTYHFYHEGSYTPLARFDCGETQAGRDADFGNLWFMHAEANGMPLLMSDESGGIVWQQTKAGLFGKIKQEKTTLSPYSAKQNLRFAGQYFDEETGLHYNTFRYYDPECGRFTQPDPIGLAGGINLYAYAPNSINYIDPLGLERTRLPRTNGYWDGIPGQSNWFSNNPLVTAVTDGKPISFSNGRPDFSPWSKGSIIFDAGVLDGSRNDFTEVYKYIADQKKITQTAARDLLSEMKLTPHHLSTTEIILVPTDLHGNVPHIGSASDMRNAVSC